VESGVAYNKAMETYRAGFSTLLGDARAGEALLAEIAQFAADTPFELPGLAQSAQTLLAFGVSSETVMDDLKMLGDISMGSQEKLNGLAVVFGQVASAGKLNGQDLNQMINNGFNPLNIIAEQTGLSMADLRDKMKDGAISFEMVSEAMKIATSEGGLFYDAMSAQSATLEGQLATLNDNFNALAGSITSGLTAAVTNEALPAVNQLIAAIDAMVAGNENAEEMLESASQAISDAVGNMIPVVMEMLGTFGEIGLELINTLAKSISDNQDALIQTAMTLIDGLIEGITSVLDVLLPIAAALLGKLVEGLIKALPTIVNGAIMLIGALGQAIIDNLPLLLKAAIQIVAELARGLAEAMPTLIPTIVKMIADMVQTLVDNAPLLLEAALALIEGLATGLINSLPVLIDALPKLIDGIIKFTLESLPMIVDAGVRLFTALIGALPEIIELIVPAIPQIINGIITAVVASTSAIIDAGFKLFVALVESLPEIIVEIVKAVPQIIKGINDSFGLMVNNVMNIGKDLLANIWNGIVAYQSWLQERIAGFFQGIVSDIGNILSGGAAGFGLAKSVKDSTPGAVAAVKERNAAMIAESKRHQDEEDALRDAANSRHYSRIKETQRNQEQADAERDAANAKYYSDEKKIATETSDLLKSLTASTAKDREKAAKAAEKAAKAAYDAEKLLIEDYRNSADYSIEGEIAMWEKLGKSHKEVSNEKVEIEKSIAKLREDLVKRDEEAAKDALKAVSDAYNQYAKKQEHQVFLLGREGDFAGQIALYGRMMDEALDTKQRYLDMGLSAESDEIMALEKAWYGYSDDIKKLYDDQWKENLSVIKDFAYDERELAYEGSSVKIKLFDEEYIARVRAIDEEKAAFLEANNAEIQAIIDRIAMTDSQSAKRLQDLRDQKQAILDASDEEKSAREAAQIAENIATKERAIDDAKRKVDEAESDEARLKALDGVKDKETALAAYLDELDYKSREKERQQDAKDLDDKIRAEIAATKTANEAAVSEAADVLDAAKEQVQERPALVDVSAEAESQAESLEQLETYNKNIVQSTADLNKTLAAQRKKAQDTEYSDVRAHNRRLIELMTGFASQWFSAGDTFMGMLIAGIRGRLGELESAAADVWSAMSFNIDTEIPAYGTGGVVTSPHLAIVGDVPEAIIPLNQISSLVTGASSLPQSALLSAGGARIVNFDSHVTIVSPERTPAQNARALANTEREFAYALG
ncbi:MAG: tape measure protein, partial [Clostridiales bacterium]|nr:tape measure protein [Clostridiales bacterium]